MSEAYDLLVVGAGPTGCVIAERAASQCGWRTLIVEKRDHVAGHCYDRHHDNGVLIHEFGPHLFRTNDDALLEYLTRFTEWIPGNYKVRSEVGGELYPFPINLTTLEKFFRRDFTPDSARAHLDEIREVIDEPANSEEFVLSRVGRDLYEAFYLNYTIKQWDRHPSDLAPSVCGRIPVRFNRDNRYVDHRHQVMPKKGYTKLFASMIDHPLINLRANCDYRDVRDTIIPRIGTVYCGQLDAYFDERLGPLPWRSLSFEHEAHEQEFCQPCLQINYPDERPYTRTVEYKHITGQKHDHTVISREFPQAQGDPFYPVPSVQSAKQLAGYEQLADEETRSRGVYFAGRLARYTYLNMDEAMLAAFETFEELRRRAVG